MDCGQVFNHFFGKLLENPGAKIAAGFFIWLASSLFGEFRPVYGFILALCIADLILGMYVAWKDPATKIESRRLRKGGVKLLIYGVLLVLGHFCSMIEFFAVIPAFIEGYIFGTEAISNIEKWIKIADLHKWDIPILKMLKAILQGKIKELEAANGVEKGADQEC